MTCSQPAGTATRWTRPTAYRTRRRRLLLGVVLVLLLAQSAGQLLNDTGHVGLRTAHTHADAHRTDVSAVSWPQQGQAALVLDNDRLVATPETRFVAEMNDAARRLRMDHTTYTGPSGFDPNTVSTAGDRCASLSRRCASPSSARSSQCRA